MTEVKCDGLWKNLIFLMIALALLSAAAGAASASLTFTELQFVIYDSTAPSINGSVTMPAAGTQYNQTQIVPLLIGTSENATIIANVSYDSTSQAVALYYNGTQWYYNSTFTSTLLPGQYNVTFNVTDMVGNSNSTSTNFTVNDVTPPNVLILTPAAGTSYAVGTQVSITANISDPYYDSLDTVLANISWDSTYVTVVMTDHNGDGVYNCSFTNTSLPYSFNVTIIANDTSGNINSTEKTNFSIVDTINPLLVNVSLSPRVVIRGRNVSINASATDNVAVDGVFANITLPNGTVRLVSLPASYTTELNGRNNATIFVNDTSGNIAYVTDYFIVAEPINITITVFDSSLSPITTNLTIYLAGTSDIVDIDTIIGNITKEEPAHYYDLLFEAYDSNITILLRDIYLPLDDNESVGIESMLPAVSGYILTYGVNTTFSFTSATVTISYAGQNYTIESNLKLDKCSSWDFTNNSCLGAWIETGALQDITADTFTLNATSFSAFSIREATAAQPSGGGHGGGIRKAEPTPEAQAQSCREDWICSNWSECMPDNVKARMCVDWNRCGTEEQMPAVEKQCKFTVTLPEKLPEIVVEMPLSLRIGEIVTMIIFVLIVIAALLLLMNAWNRMMYPPEMWPIEFIELEAMLPIDESKEKGIIRKFEVEKVEDFKEIIEFARHGPAVMLISIKKMIHKLDDLKRGVRILKKTLKATDGDIAGLRDHWVIATSFSIKIAKSNFVKDIAKEVKNEKKKHCEKF
jgi:SepF-like predicted cell division protein (DUF552 family)